PHIRRAQGACLTGIATDQTSVQRAHNGCVPDELPELTVANASAWGAWLTANHDSSAGVWLVLAKQGTSEPTTLAYEQALQEALCHGWIDGQVKRRDA